MTGFAMFLHAFISILLVVIILMQSGRGGGLTEGFASAESMFGAQTNKMLIKTTTVLATLFFITCLGLAVLSSQKGKSLMAGSVAPEVQEATGNQVTGKIINDEEGLRVEMDDPQAPVSVVTEPPLDVLPTDVPADTIPESE